MGSRATERGRLSCRCHPECRSRPARFVELARRRGAEQGDRVSYRHIDAADRAALAALGPRTFDAAACKMAMMDMAVIRPLFAALAELLRPGGRFVFSVLHPAFNSTGTGLWLEETTLAGGALAVSGGVKVTRYLGPETRRGVGIRGQPQPQLYFHRPISLLFNVGFEAGFVLVGIEEPGFGPDDAPRASSPGPGSRGSRRCWWPGCACRGEVVR